MCGIAGFVSHTPVDRAQVILDAMAQSVRHRGPDFQGRWVERGPSGLTVGLAHSLLAIIGKPGEGRQPFVVPGGVLVFNGALYNFKELREALTPLHLFRTDTDTEVLAIGLREQGVKFLKQIRGMFAFAFWNEKTHTLLLGRDNLGVKPLYYYQSKEVFCFASEYKSIIPHLSGLQIDDDSICDYLRLRYVGGESTLFRQIKKIKAGTVLELSLESMLSNEETYFDITSMPKPGGDLLETLRLAVTRRAVADVEVGALLSGGIDSAVVCELLSQNVSRLQSYTLKIDFGTLDESVQARLIAEDLGIENTVINSEAPSIERMESLSYHLDDPYGDPIILALDQIFRKIKGRNRVVVTGEGADELFSGYVHHRALHLLHQFRPLGKLLPLCAGLVRRLIPHVLPYSGRLTPEDYQQALQRLKHAFSRGDLQAFQGIFFAFDNAELEQPKRSYLFGDASSPALLSNLRRWDYSYWLPDSQLFKLDKISMASSIEAREPFVDVDLIQLIEAVPVGSHVKWFSDKPVLRKMARQLRVGRRVSHIRKTSFYQPFNQEVAGTLANEVSDLLKEEHGFLRQYVKTSPLTALFDPSSSRIAHQKKRFSLAMLALWKRKVLSRVGQGVPLE